VKTAKKLPARKAKKDMAEEVADDIPF